MSSDDGAIAELDAEIRVIKFALAARRRFNDEAAWHDYLNNEADRMPELAPYVFYTVGQLHEEKLQLREEKLLLQRNLAGAGDASSVRNAYEDGIALGLSLASSRQRHDSYETPASYAAGVKFLLDGAFFEVDEGSGPSFLTEAERDAARASIYEAKHERFLVAYMTPLFNEKLMSILPSDYVLVNSEEYPWIPQSTDANAHYVAPAHFVCPHYLVEFRPHPYNNAPSCGGGGGGGGEYGKFPVYSARRSIAAVGDANMKLDNAGEGEFMKCLEALSFSSDESETIVVRGFVYDCDTCSLMTAVAGRVTQVTTFKWTTPGSFSIFRDYFQDYERDWHVGLKAACFAFGVSLPRYSSALGNCGQCLLGEGAFGRVFEVLRGEQRLALKLATAKEGFDALISEFQVATKLPVAAQSSVVAVEEGSLWRDCVDKLNSPPLLVVAFLMTTVGVPFRHPSEVTDAFGPLILESLSDLHDAKVYHGDARYKNVVRLESTANSNGVEFRWIDLRTVLGVSPWPFEFQNDFITFFNSIGRPYDIKAFHRFAVKTSQRTWSSPDARREAARRLWHSAGL